MRWLIIIALVALGLPCPAVAQTLPVQRIQVGVLSRTYLLDRFHADQAQGRLPIVIFLHGLGTLISEGVLPRFDIRFADLPSMEPALIVRPQGVNRRWDSVPGRIATWRRLSGTDGEPVDDIAFLRALIEHLVADENGDPARVYVAESRPAGSWCRASRAKWATRWPRWRM